MLRQRASLPRMRIVVYRTIVPTTPAGPGSAGSHRSWLERSTPADALKRAAVGQVRAIATYRESGQSSVCLDSGRAQAPPDRTGPLIRTATVSSANVTASGREARCTRGNQRL